MTPDCVRTRARTIFPTSLESTVSSKVLLRSQTSDINECQEGTHDCYQKEKCLNVEGGFDCTCPDNTACISVLVLMGESWYTPKFIDSMGLEKDWDCFKLPYEYSDWS